MGHRLPAGLRAWLGIEISPIRPAERWISGLGGFAGIFAILVVSRAVLGDLEPALLVVGSMGASAVLLFAVPHGPLSQPWALVGGHLVSAVIGVAVARQVPQPALAAALAVGVAIAHSDLEWALHEIDSALDVREQDLARVYALALEHARTGHLAPWQIGAHRFYSNGRLGAEWAIREVTHHDAARDRFAWRVVAGDGEGDRGEADRSELARWARREVFRTASGWSRSVVG